MRTFLLWIAVALLLAAGCEYDIVAPAVPEITVNVSGGDTDTCTPGSCDLTAMKGRVYRLTSLVIDEPAAFAQILNVMWLGDIKNNTLNVLIVVDDVVAGTLQAFSDVKITLGPAWREPKFPYVLPAASGLPTDAPTMVTDYCLLKGLSVDVDLAPYAGTVCELKSAAETSLYFHSGPKDAPLICAPDNAPANNIPISDLSIRASFNKDCSSITNGFLLGCIKVEDADRICMCMGAGTCPHDGVVPAGGVTYDDPDDLGDSCHEACGGDFLSFGSIIRSFSLAPACLTPDGKQGYFVQAFFDATEIDASKYNPVSSDDCSQH